jgi:hypothetical protein
MLCVQEYSFLKMDWNNYWDTGHPFCLRTWIRSLLPSFLLKLGIASKGEDCEELGGNHRWYNIDGQNSGCYHCKVVRSEQLWDENT